MSTILAERAALDAGVLPLEMTFFPGENANLGFAISLTEASFGIVSSPKIRPRNPDLVVEPIHPCL